MAEFGMTGKQIDILLNFAAQNPSLAFGKPGQRRSDHDGYRYFLWKEVGRELNYSYENDRDWKAYNYWPVIWRTLKQKTRNKVQYHKKKFAKSGKMNVSWDEYPLKDYEKTILKLNDSFRKGELKDEEDRSDADSDVECEAENETQSISQEDIKPSMCEPEVIIQTEDNNTNVNTAHINNYISCNEDIKQMHNAIKAITDLTKEVSQNVISLKKSLDGISESIVATHYLVMNNLNRISSEYYRPYSYY